MLYLKGKVRKIRTIMAGTRKDGTTYGTYHLLSVETLNKDANGDEDPQIQKFNIDDPTQYKEGQEYLFSVRLFKDRLYIQGPADMTELYEPC